MNNWTLRNEIMAKFFLYYLVCIIINIILHPNCKIGVTVNRVLLICNRPDICESWNKYYFTVNEYVIHLLPLHPYHPKNVNDGGFSNQKAADKKEKCPCY